MNQPIAHPARTVVQDVVCFSSTTPVPGFGALPVNAYLLEAAAPTLVDAGLPALTEDTLEAIGAHLDPADLRFVFLTHCDADHVGALAAILELAPKARVVTNYLGMGKLTMRLSIPPQRFYLINPGQTLDLGDRTLRAVALPAYDAPETMGAFDPTSRCLFSSDCFGALLADHDGQTPIGDASQLGADDLDVGMKTWATVDAPWIADIPAETFRRRLERLRGMAPERVLSAHLPPARDLAALCRSLDGARSMPPFVGPDQAALEALLAQVA